jgi:uncharacterized protein YlxW (UPF0749 family)
MLAAALVLGMLVSFQWSAGAERKPLSTDRVNTTIDQLELEQADLKRRVSALRRELDARQQRAVANTGSLEGVRSELMAQKARAGLVALRGPGIVVRLDDSPRAMSGNAVDMLVHDYDLRDVLAVLWLAGAEAVSVNDERIVYSTSVYCVGSTIMVNDTRLSPPYEITAIGDAVALQDHVGNPGYLSNLKTRSERHGVRLEVVRADSLMVPAYQGSVSLRFAQPGR